MADSSGAPSAAFAESLSSVVVGWPCSSLSCVDILDESCTGFSSTLSNELLLTWVDIEVTSVDARPLLECEIETVITQSGGSVDRV